MAKSVILTKVQNAFRHGGVRVVLSFVLLIILAVLPVFFIHWLPVKSDYTKVMDAIGGLNKEIQNIKMGNEANESMKQASLAAEQIEKRLVAAPESGYLESEINKLSAKAGLRLSIENQGNHPVKGAIKSDFNITLNGQYGDLRKFIHSIETMKQLAVIESIRIEEDSAGQGLVKAMMKLSIIHRYAAVSK
ncbi:MAG: type 4a pilus biogenesis protein PilO [Candidatus Goldbacteria bacterium]|nr:type 4a pilus biogenesis protein PilO [Candidatus Goldiibacteriota bacterium]